MSGQFEGFHAGGLGAGLNAAGEDTCPRFYGHLGYVVVVGGPSFACRAVTQTYLSDGQQKARGTRTLNHAKSIGGPPRAVDNRV